LTDSTDYKVTTFLWTTLCIGMRTGGMEWGQTGWRS